MLWHRASRPIERAAWDRMLHDPTPESDQQWSERVVRWWAEQRLRRSVARDLENNTLQGALRQLIRAGLPITAVLIAVNPIWGFSWYFNSENWATAVWQKIAESRVDEWREAMIDAAVRARGGVQRHGAGRLRRHRCRHRQRRFLVPRDRRSRRGRPVATRASRPTPAGSAPRRGEVRRHRLGRRVSGRCDERLRAELLPAAEGRRKADLRDSRQPRLVQRARRLCRQPDAARIPRVPRSTRASRPTSACRARPTIASIG